MCNGSPSPLSTTPPASSSMPREHQRGQRPHPAAGVGADHCTNADPNTAAQKMALAVSVAIGNAGNASPTDADFKATVANLWNLFAQVAV